MEELVARLEVLHRRVSLPGGDTQTKLVVQDLTMDLLRQEVQRDGTSITLQPREYMFHV